MKVLRLIMITLLISLFTEQQAQAEGAQIILKDVQSDTTHYFQYNAEEHGYKSIRSNVLTPSYYVYAGQRDLGAAEQLVADLQIADHIQEWGATIRIIPPIDPSGYNSKDAEAFVELLSKEPVRNVKVIGIDEGATFVNNYLSDQKGYAIAGVMLYGGDIDGSRTLSVALPVYLSNPTSNVLSYYVQGNAAMKQAPSLGADNAHPSVLTYFANKENPYKQVVASSHEESLAEAFQNAWKTVLSRNYRMHNEETEFYLSDPRKQTKEYPLTGVPIFEELNLTYHQMMDQPVLGEGKYMWFEYVPTDIETFADQTVPLVVTLHGTGNDPRIQGDTSGWTELASTEKFIVVSPEWEDISRNFNKNEGLGDEGVSKLVVHLKEKYPQIDPSRIYVTGLSAGGSKTALYGAKYSHIFAAAAAVSAPGVDKTELTEISNHYTGGEVPFLYVTGEQDYFQMVPVDGSSQYGQPGIFDKDPNVSMFEFIQAYQRINKLPVSATYDLSLNEFYGVLLENQAWSTLGDKDIFSGTLSNANGDVMLQLAVIKNLAHWNYKPEAAWMWDFFKNYRRDVQTGELITVHPEQE